SLEICWADRARSRLLAAVVATFAVFTSPAEAQRFYRLESAVTLKGAAPNWDYVTFEAARSYLYIARREDGVTVYDVNAKRVVREINAARANATPLVRKFDRGYTANEDGTATAFQLSSLNAVKRIKLAEGGDSAVYEPVTKQVAFTAGDSKEIVFLDPRSDAVVGRLPLESAKLEHPTADGQGNVFVAQRDRDCVVRIDTKLRKPTAEWKTQACEEPNGLAFDPVHKRLFVGCRGKGKSPVLAGLDPDTGKVVATIEIGR